MRYSESGPVTAIIQNKDSGRYMLYTSVDHYSRQDYFAEDLRNEGYSVTMVLNGFIDESEANRWLREHKIREGKIEKIILKKGMVSI